MVAIRLRRAGSKKRPFFRVVVTDSRAARDSSFVEILGHYNPRTKPALVDVNKERVEYWMKNGAQPSDSVRTLIARQVEEVGALLAGGADGADDSRFHEEHVQPEGSALERGFATVGLAAHA